MYKEQNKTRTTSNKTISSIAGLCKSSRVFCAVNNKVCDMSENERNEASNKARR